jgi:hypothetical protein
MKRHTALALAAALLLGPRPPLGAAPAGAAAVEAAARGGKYLFVLFYKEEDAATRAMRQALAAGLSGREARAGFVAVKATDPAEKALVDRFGVSRAPLPLVLALAPNGAVTGGFPLKLTEQQVAQAFVSPAQAASLKALQARKLVLLCVLPGAGAAPPQGVRDFVADPQYRTAAEVVTVAAGDPAEATFLKQLQVEAHAAAVTVLLAPPGPALGTFTGAVTKEQLVEKLKAARSGCCPGGCCPGGCCGPKR